MIFIIGLGINGRSSLSIRALRLIDHASILIGGKRHLAFFPEFKGERRVIGSDLNAVEKAIKKAEKAGNRIVVLATGDPNFFGIAEFITQRFAKESVEIIPNVTTMQETFARIKESWNDARFLSLHGRGRTIDDVAGEIARQEKIGIFTDPENTPSRIAKALLEKGIKDYRAYVCEGLGTEQEKVREGTLGQIARKRFSPLNVMVLVRVQGSGLPLQAVSRGFRGQKTTIHLPLTTYRSFGIPDSEFSHYKGMITKEEVRVVTISKLRLHENCTLWDIGAGCGSLSIEAALLFPSTKIYAIERDPEALRFIEKNIEKFRTQNICIISGEAPEAFRDLLDPDRVFIGGSGSRLDDILKMAGERIRSGGTIVINAVTLDTLTKATAFLNDKGWETEVVAINIAKAKQLRGKKAFEGLNPVYIITGKRI